MNNISYYKDKINSNKELFIGKSKIIKNETDAVVIKKCTIKCNQLFDYLKVRGFDYYPELLESINNDEIVYRYMENDNIPSEQKLIDLAKVVGLLHLKTVYFKTVSKDKYLSIKDNIENNIKYLRNYYDSLFMNILKKEYQNPEEYLYARNYSIILSNLNFCEEKINDWYDIIKDKNEMRVCTVHNNISLEHFIDSEKKYLISWDKYITDSPIFDITNFIKNDYNKINLDTFFNEYFSVFPFNEDEKILLNIFLMMPPYIEISSIVELKNNFKYLYTISNYIVKNNEEKINI